MKKVYIIECVIWIILTIICTFNKNIGIPIFYAVNSIRVILTLLCVGRPVGARKHLKKEFIKAEVSPNINIQEIMSAQTKQAFKIVLLWVLFLVCEGIVNGLNLLNEQLIVLVVIGLRILSNLFVLVWCPFGVIMHNKCCTECRIFNWDELMVNSPMIFIPNIFSIFALLLSLFIFIQWEWTIAKHPERFISEINKSIDCKCSACTLCGRCKRKNGQWSLVLRDFLL